MKEAAVQQGARNSTRSPLRPEGGVALSSQCEGVAEAGDIPPPADGLAGRVVGRPRGEMGE